MTSSQAADWRRSTADWDSYFSIIAEGAQYIPWIVGVGNHEMEPLTAAGYAGVLTRFPDLAAAANGGSNTEVKGSRFTFREPSFTWNGYSIKQGETYNTGSPVARSFTYGNVAFIQLDGNDLSAEIANNNGYTGGQQTTWLLARLATYRSPNSAIDFVIVYFHNCAYSSNTSHGSDAGIRNVWQPIFDNWNVDLVINGHVHAHERTNRSSTTKWSRPSPPEGATRTSTPSRATVRPRRARSPAPPTSAPEAAAKACTPTGSALGSSLCDSTRPVPRIVKTGHEEEMCRLN